MLRNWFDGTHEPSQCLIRVLNGVVLMSSRPDVRRAFAGGICRRNCGVPIRSLIEGTFPNQQRSVLLEGVLDATPVTGAFTCTQESEYFVFVEE